jgi:hypothetical protein
MPKIGRVTTARRNGFTMENAANTAVTPHRTLQTQPGVPVPNSIAATRAAIQIDQPIPLARL